jgi:putative membrane-bound dehydrogenase-like protein
MLHRAALPLLAAGFASRLMAAEPQVDSAQLPRVLPTPPERAASTFKVKPGFRIELVAAEPLVFDPIALSFDEDGRCYVVEMRDYSERRPERLGRIRLLEDTDGDGRFDKSTVFAQDLPWPTAVICWEGGVFVGATPDILYFKDTDRDGVADVREVLFSGFASDYAPFATNKLNVQAMFNSFNWSLDNRIHGASGGSGGQVRRLDSPFTREWLRRGGAAPPTGTQTPPAVDLRGKDFSFDPRTLEFRVESGGAQYGLTFDNLGRKFVCSNSDHIQQVIYEERYLGRNAWFSLPSPRVSIAADGPAAPVYRLSPDEPWRVLRTQWRVTGVVPGLIEGGGRPSGYFTGATGVTIYRGDALGEDFVGDAFIADCGSNLVHRKKLRPAPNGISFIAERAADEQAVEFLASRDNWFRPVQFANAPDGTLYLCDMYREIIEHPWSLPESIKKHLDLNSGNDRGRIYRVVPENFRQRPPPHLGRLSSVELVQTLGHANGWHRDTAARLLYQRQDAAAVPALEGLVAEWVRSPANRTPTPLARVHGLYGLAGMNRLEERHVRSALMATNAVVRVHGLRLAENFLGNPSAGLMDTLASVAWPKPLISGSVAADFQMAWTLGRVRPPEKEKLASAFLSRLSRDGHPGVTKGTNQPDASAWFLPALMNSIGSDPVDVLRRAATRSSPALPPAALNAGEKWDDSRPSPPLEFQSVRDQLEMVMRFARLIGTRNISNEVARTVEVLERLPANSGRHEANPDTRLGWEFAAALEEGLAESGSSLRRYGAVPKLAQLFRLAKSVAFDASHRSADDRLAAIKALASAPESGVRSNLLGLVASVSEAPALQKAALSALARPVFAGFEQDALERWPQLAPAIRSELLVIVLRRVERIPALLTALENGTVRPAELDVAQQASLRSHKDQALRERAMKLLGPAAFGTRQSAVESFQPALALTGAASNGQIVFQARCAQCHRLAGQGYVLGPDLASVRANGKEKLLAGILNPNREVAPQYSSYLVETKDGESLAGLLVNESANSVTLRMAGGAESVVARANIASMQSRGKSLMPEGLEEGLSQQDMADLLEFIVATP